MFEYLSGNSTPRKVKGTVDMKPTRTRLVWIAAALSSIAIAAPVSTAGAATAARAAGPGAGTPTTVIGPTYITSAPSTFINTNNQVSPGNNSSGDQVAA
jgi:hypothetical protein